MRKINQYFNSEQLSILSEIGISFDDEKDYSVDELLDIHDVITENLPIRFDSDGAPTKRMRIFEQIIDIFYDELDI